MVSGIGIITGIFLTMSAAVGQGTTSSQSTTPIIVVGSQDDLPAQTVDVTNRSSVEKYVKSYFSDIPALVAVARCESAFRQVGMDGEVLRGANPEDVGVMQINEKYHGARASELGYDLTTLDGNLGFARYLYDKRGLAPWASSKSCWDRILTNIIPGRADEG